MFLIDIGPLVLLLCIPVTVAQDYYGKKGTSTLSFNIPGVAKTITLTQVGYVTITQAQPEPATLTKTIHDVIKMSPVTTTVSQPLDTIHCNPTQTVTKQGITKTLTTLYTTTVISTRFAPCSPADQPCNDYNHRSDDVFNSSNINNNSTLTKSRVTVTSLVTNNPIITAGLLIILGITVFSCCVILTAIKCSQARKNVRRARRLSYKWSQHIWREKEMTKAIQRNKAHISHPIHKAPQKTSDNAPTLPDRNIKTETNDIEMNDLKSLQRQAAACLGAIPKQTKAIIHKEPNTDSDSPDHPLTKDSPDYPSTKDSQNNPTTANPTANLTLINHNTNANGSNDDGYCTPNDLPGYRGMLGGVI